jgi:hypothetical protein
MGDVYILRGGVIYPTPVYPFALDSDQTLFRVNNGTQSVLVNTITEDATSLQIIPTKANDLEIWPDNGFATLVGELIYYDAVDKDENGKVFRLKRLSRAVEGIPKSHSAGTPIYGYAVAQHHNQLVDAIVEIEKTIGDLADIVRNEPVQGFGAEIGYVASLHAAMNSMKALSAAPDDTCPDIDFQINSNVPVPGGTQAEFCVRIFPWDFSWTYELDFGDGSITTDEFSGVHQWNSGGPYTPRVTVITPRCTLVVQASQADPGMDITPSVSPVVSFHIPIPEVPDFPKFIAPRRVCPGPLYNLPPILIPKLELCPKPVSMSSCASTDFCSVMVSIVGCCNMPSEISIIGCTPPSTIRYEGCCPPSIITIESNLPSIIQLEGTFNTPSVVRFEGCCPPSIIKFEDCPSLVKVDWGTPPSVIELKCQVPSAITVDCCNLPSVIDVKCCEFPKISVDCCNIPQTISLIGKDVKVSVDVDVPTIHVADNIPTIISIDCCVPSIISIDCCIPSSISIDCSVISIDCCSIISVIDNIPSIISVIDNIPSIISVVGFPSYVPMKIINLPSYIPIKFEDIPSICCPSITVDWRTPPTVSCVVTVVCPSTTNNNNPPQQFAANFQDGFGTSDAIPVEINDIGIPEEIKVVVPTIPNIRIIHDIPRTIMLKAPDIPDIRIIGPEKINVIDNIPRSIHVEATEVPKEIKLNATEVPSRILVEAAANFPSIIRLEALGIPETLQVTGIPKSIEVIGVPSAIQLIMPENPTVELVYKGPPLELRLKPELEKALSQIIVV